MFGDTGLATALKNELDPSLHIDLARHAVPQPATNLVVWICPPTPDVAECSVAVHCWEKGIPLLRLRYQGRCAELGPLVDPRMTPCLDCLVAEDEGDQRTAVDGDDALVVSLLARDLFAMVSRTTPSPLPMRWRKVDLEDLSQHEVSAASREGCRQCSSSRGAAAAHAPLAARFEASVAMPPKAFADLKAHQMHYKPSNLALQRRSKGWPVAPRLTLSPPPFELLSRPWLPGAPDSGRPPTTKLNQANLSLLLLTVAGIKGDSAQKVLRWTASGGNIGSVTAYVVLRDCTGIVPGVYGYASETHQLARLATDTAPFDGQTPVTLVLTGDFRKVAQKYSAFALRILLLDSGCAQATAAAVCSTLSLGLTFRPSWDDEAIAAGLAIDPDVEPITAVADIGGTA